MALARQTPAINPARGGRLFTLEASPENTALTDIVRQRLLPKNSPDWDVQIVFFENKLLKSLALPRGDGGAIKKSR
jgi:hypothetical protein